MKYITYSIFTFSYRIIEALLGKLQWVFLMRNYHWSLPQCPFTTPLFLFSKIQQYTTVKRVELYLNVLVHKHNFALAEFIGPLPETVDIFQLNICYQ